MQRGPDVIIPVHDAFGALSACLASLDAASPDVPVVVVDDASQDPRVAPLLREWTAAAAHRELLSNETNLGFVKTVNRAMASTGNDVVLLNSDTLVTPGWYEALARCLASDRSIATATPWSNNGEIVSVPEFCQSNPVPESPGRFAVAAARSKQGDYPELPTAVGFCMAISRIAIRTLGLFDEQTFGAGYGEENDFSLRASAAGMRNVLCDDAYVVHIGGQSFGPLGLRPGEASMQRLLGKHPGYLELVSRWIAADPLAARRADLVAALASGPD